MNQVKRRIRALITLLGDDEPKVRDIAQKELLEQAESSMPILKEVVHSDSEGRIRIEACVLLEEMRLNDLEREFNSLLSARDFDLEQGCFILAQVEYPDLNVAEYVGQIDQLAREAQKRIQGVRDGMRVVERLNGYLFDEVGLRGNVKSYNDPENSFINRVLDRHLGIPISLSAIYLFIAKRLNLPIYGVGFPRHFLLKYRPEIDMFYIDVFNKGRILTREDCANVLHRQGYAFYDSYLATATPKEILARMIRNLVVIYDENSQIKKIDVLERIFCDFFIQEEEDGF